MKHLLQKPHAIFSTENAAYPDKVQKQVSQETAMEALKRAGSGQVVPTKGKYGSEENSILVSDPDENQMGLVRHLAKITGQESHIESDGLSHKIVYNHGEKAGQTEEGKGTTFHEKRPDDFYSELPDGTIFTHNLGKSISFNAEADALNKADSQIQINPEHGKQIAQAYHEMKHDPNHPEVKAAYGALVNEIGAQYKEMLGQGFKASKMKEGQPNPYKNSKDLHADIEQNNHMHYFPTEQGYGSDGSKQVSNHPLLQPTQFKDAEGQPMLANDVFRIVHDYHGHHLGGKSGFGPKGEHQAYLQHKKTLSPLAQKALASETLGQNSYVNFGPDAEHNKANPSQTKYAEQKAGLLPDSIINGNWHTGSMGKSEKISIPKKDFVKEHKKLVNVLRSPSRKDDLVEAKDQQKELDSELAKSKNVREQRKKVFGITGEPQTTGKKNKEFHQKQSDALSRLTEKRYNAPLVESKGKFYPLGRINQMRSKAGEAPLSAKQISKHPDFETSQNGNLFRFKEQKPNPKPDWRSGQLESQRHIGAKVHELSHLEEMQPGLSLPQMQEKMDEGSSIAGKKYGGAAKQTEMEIIPMAIENLLRRRAGIPTFGRPQTTDPRHSKIPLTQDSPPRISRDTGRPYATRVKDDKGQPVDLIAQSKNVTPQIRQKMKDVDEGTLKFHPQRGWYEADDTDALINLRAQGRGDEATQRLKQKAVPAKNKLAASEKKYKIWKKIKI